MNTPNPVIPDVIAGITHQQVTAYFTQLSAIAGFNIGYAAANGPRLFATHEAVSAGTYVSVLGETPADAVSRHIERRPLTGLALAQQKLAEAQQLLAIEQAKAGAPF